MEETIKRPPFPVDFEERVYRAVFAGKNYFLWRPDTIYDPFYDANPVEGWDTYCTACEQAGFLSKKGNKITRVAACPRCGASVKSVRYDRRELRRSAPVMYLQRGCGTDVFLYLFDARCAYSIQDGYEVELDVQRIWNFDHGISREWELRTTWDFGTPDTEWVMLKRSACEPGGVSSPHMMPPDWDTLAGSCVQYASLDAIWERLCEITTNYNGGRGGTVNYLRRFVQSPMVMEYLYKGGFERLVLDACGTGADAVRRVVNWRAKKPERIFKLGGLDKAERRALRGESTKHIETYLQLRKYGEKPGGVLLQFVPDATALDELLTANEVLRRDLRRTIKYLRHMARQEIGTFGDYRDYMRDLRTLQELGLCGEPDAELLYPSAFQRVHADKARLAARAERRAKSGENKWKWRARRQEAAWLRWSWGGMCIRPVDSDEDIITEGEQNHNCVAGYANEHLSRHCCILVLRRQAAPRDSWYTVELDERTLEVRQCRAAHNGPGSVQDKADKDAFLERWLARLGRLRAQGQTRRCA